MMGEYGMTLAEIVLCAEAALRLRGCMKVVCPGIDREDHWVGLMAVHYGAAIAGIMGSGNVRVIRRWHEDGGFEALVVMMPPPFSSDPDSWCHDGSS
jgi:hypothetical protein